MNMGALVRESIFRGDEEAGQLSSLQGESAAERERVYLARYEGLWDNPVEQRRVRAKVILASLQSGEAYFPFGVPEPNPRRHAVRDVGVIETIQHLLVFPRFPTIVICNEPSQVSRALYNQNPTIPFNELRKRALQDNELLGAREELMWDSMIKETRCEMRRKDRRFEGWPLPVATLSQMLEGEEGFEVLHERVKALAKDNPAFAELAFQCAKDKIRPCRGMESFMACLSKHAEHAYDFLIYTLYEVAVSLFLGGIKISHSGEKPYDELTSMAKILLGWKGQFSVCQVPWESPYKNRNDKVTAARPLLSCHLDPTVEENHRFDISEANRDPRFLNDNTGFYAFVDQVHEMGAVRQQREAETAGRIAATRDRFFHVLSTKPPLPPDETRRLEILEVFHTTVEFLRTFTHNTRMHCLMKEAGLLDFLETGELGEVGARSLIPFTCKRRTEGNESPEAHFVRCAVELIDGFYGPVLDSGSFDFMAGIRRDHMNLLDCAKVHKLAEDPKREISEHENYWNLTFGRFYRKMFARHEVPFNINRESFELERERWRVLESLFDEIRGVEFFEQWFRFFCYFKQKRWPVFSELRGGNMRRRAERIKTHLENPLFSEHLRVAFAECFLREEDLCSSEVSIPMRSFGLRAAASAVLVM